MINIVCQKRDILKKSYSKDIKKSGKVPGVLYAKGIENINLIIDISPANFPVKHTYAETVNLKIEDKEYKALMREVQVHPVSGNIMHVDFQAVKDDSYVKTNISLNFKGITKEQKKEGHLRPLVRSLKVKGIVSKIPASIDIDISHLKIGGVVYVKDVNLPEGVMFNIKSHIPIALLAKR